MGDVVDRVLEATVVPSFTRIGAAVRSRLDDWVPLDQYDLTGRVVVITGATSGLGRAAAEILAGNGATIEVVARNEERALALVGELGAGAPDAPHGYVCADMGDLHAVRAAAETLRTRHDRIHVLVHNAGALDAEMSRTADGIEQTVASQVVGPFLLTALLLDRLRAAKPGRVLWMTSGGMYTQALEVDALDPDPESYRGSVAYARAKRAQVALVEMMAARLDPTEVVVHAVHPGWADTPGVARSLPTFRKVLGPLLRTPAQGADTLVWLASDDGEPLRSSGRLWHDRRTRSPHRLGRTRSADTPSERRRLWEWVSDHAGVDLPERPQEPR
jgi:NAD(P)-dependent dehydrogenase (short-subunit alcohol dehydrogenase family)